MLKQDLSVKPRAHHLASQFPQGTHLHLELQAGDGWAFTWIWGWGTRVQIPKQVLKGWAISRADKAILIPGLSVIQLSNSICGVQSVTDWGVRKKK